MNVRTADSSSPVSAHGAHGFRFLEVIEPRLAADKSRTGPQHAQSPHSPRPDPARDEARSGPLPRRSCGPQTGAARQFPHRNVHAALDPWVSNVDATIVAKQG